ncbi:PAS domain S-box-containing protein [Arenibacter palladensis]|uniref:histidine kinase n=1 Tax=Arenibacter palladensis TaxID=237373 RepID=A0A1M5CUB9_9FLAO|nr:PAS domain S-box protein [Arenibacter palladensis]SHF58358.1 PAS domain S-box-containing protein [Arenibacter palladensis]
MPKNNITALKKTFNDLLKKEDDFFNFAGESLMDGLWCWNLAHPEKSFISDKFSQLLGYSSHPRTAVQVDFLSLVHPEDIEGIQSSCQGLQNKSLDNPLNIDVRLSHADGHYIWLNLRGKLVADESQDCLGLIGTALCIDRYMESERQLQINKDYYENVIKGANIGVWEGNLVTGKVVCNERWANMFGYTLVELEPLTYDTFLNLVHPEDMERIDISLENHIKESGIYEVEFRMLHKMGHWVWVLSRGEVTKYGADGHPEIVSGIHYDISSRKINEILLEKYKNLFERSSEIAKIGYWEVDEQENTVFWSKVNKQIHGVSEDYTPTVEAGLDFYLEGENRERIKKVVSESLQKPMEFDEQLQIRMQRGKLKWVRVIGASEYKGNKSLRLYGLIQDIDEIKKVQLEIKFREEQFRQTFNHSAMGMALINIENRLLKANKSLCLILGYTEEELQKMDLANMAHPEDLKLNRKYIEELFQGKHKNIKLEHRFIHKDGSVIWANISMSAIHNDRGQVIHYVSQMQDITERKQNELLLAHNAQVMQRINDAVRIGIWELDLVTNNVHWSPTIKKMVEVSEDYKPTLEEVYPFFQEGEDRETLIDALGRAVEQGEGFDLELKVVTTSQRVFWSRTIGIPEMVDGVCTRLYGFFQDIDEKTRTTKDLAVKEEEMRQTFEHAQHGMAFIDLNGNLQKSNSSLSRIIGYSEAELRKLTLVNITYPDDYAKSQALLYEVLQRKRDSYKVEKRFVHKNGEIIWVNHSLSAIKNDKGEYMHLLSQVEDITDRKKSELLLIENKNLLERSHEIGKIGSWVYLPQENKVTWSENLINMLEADNYKPHKLEFSIANYALEKDKDRITEILNLAVAEGKSFDFESEILSKSKGIFWARHIGVPEFKDGKCIRISGLMQDIDREKRLKLELAFSEEIFRTTFEHAAIGMVVIDLKGRLQKANPKICEILGYGEKEILERTVFDFVHPEDVESAKDLFERTIVTLDGFKMEKRCRHRNGSYLWIYEAVAAVKNDKGELMHFVAQIQDISDKKQMTENLTEHNNRLTNFAHIVSHNLRSHTSNISMLLDLAVQDDPKVLENEYCRNIKVVSDNMNETIRQLSEIVEINSQVSSTLTSQNLLRRVQKAMKTVDPLVKKNKATVIAEVDSNINVLAVHAYLESIILNMITNALKYKSPERLPELKITSGTKGEYAFLSFEDNGLGIDLERHGSKLFGMYKTFHSHPEARGIGLFISKNQIEAMGGRIEVESELKKGTKFTAYFRIAG